MASSLAAWGYYLGSPNIKGPNGAVNKEAQIPARTLRWMMDLTNGGVLLPNL
ncbi:hypothetical protein [Paenibacillus sp. GCM10027626]|uniref:hypothetical protein n=1 Tax=Paenibacillus sp. GCM10027626 TaxID=3273411 RepID=UPI003627A217